MTCYKSTNPTGRLVSGPPKASIMLELNSQKFGCHRYRVPYTSHQHSLHLLTWTRTVGTDFIRGGCCSVSRVPKPA